jgi:5-methylcytosine-specific restriction endonuclease McrA
MVSERCCKTCKWEQLQRTKHDLPRIKEAPFILGQIERVEACECSDGMKDCGCGYHDCNRMVRCPYCTNRRADLLALQNENLKTACEPCNRRKAARMPEDFVCAG